MSKGWGRSNFFPAQCRRRGRNRQIKEGLRGRKRGEAGGRLLRFTAAPRCCAGALTDDADARGSRRRETAAAAMGDGDGRRGASLDKLGTGVARFQTVRPLVWDPLLHRKPTGASYVL